jgi:Triosephosphate isomerase
VAMMKLFHVIAFVLNASVLQTSVAYQPHTFSSTRLSSSLMQLCATNHRKPFITGNWKMNPKTNKEAIELASDIAAAVTPESPGDVAIFVPYPFIESVQNAVGDKLLVGAEVCAICKLVYGAVAPNGIFLLAYNFINILIS